MLFVTSIAFLAKYPTKCQRLLLAVLELACSKNELDGCQWAVEWILEGLRLDQLHTTCQAN